MRTNTAIAECRRRAVAPYLRLLSLREAIVLAGVTEREKDVRNDISHGVLSAARVVRFDNSRLCFHWPYVLTFAAVYGNEFLDSSELRRIALDRVYVAASNKLEANGCASIPDIYKEVTHFELRAFFLECQFSRFRVAIDNYIDIDLGRACEDVKPRVDLYTYGLDRVEEKDSVLGGAAVFRDTRISVAHIGKMVERGETIANILEDYPKLTESDVKFAELYYCARPPVGRPPRVTGATGHVEHSRK